MTLPAAIGLSSSGATEPTLAQTDPELVECFDNFAYDAVLAHSDLDPRTRVMVQLASMIATQALAEFRIMADAALTATLTPIELKEVVYQAVPYLGLPKVADFVHATNELLTARGVSLPLDGQSTTTPDNHFERGLAVQKEIVGADRLDGLYAAAPEDSRHIQTLLSATCFGDYLARAGLTLAERELLIFAMLSALGGCDAQVRGHVLNNLNVGNTRARLLGVLTVLIPYIGYPRMFNALAALDELTLS